MLTNRETQTKTLEQICAEAKHKFLAKAPKLIKKTKGSGRK